VYGLHLAKDSIRKNKRAVIVEGNLDVIASHEAGVREVVATAGTAMTEMHLKALQRFTTDIRLAFDQDVAGINATERAIPIASKVGVSISMIDIPAGKDPDELIKKDPKLWVKAIETHQDALDWLIAQYEKRSNLETHAGRGEFKEAVLSSVKRLESDGEQGLYAKKVAKILGYNEDAIKDELKLIKQGRKTYKVVQNKPMPIDKQELEHKKIQEHLLALALMQPTLRHFLDPITNEMLSDEGSVVLKDFLAKHPDFAGEAAQAEELRDIGDYVKILRLQYEELYQDLEITELQYEATRMQVRLIDQYVKAQKTVLAETMRTADEATMPGLLKQAKELDQLLKAR
jgi:DNA primase